MMISQDGHIIGLGTSAEIAVDVLTIIDCIVKNENSKEIIDNMIKCNYETDSSTLADFAKILTERMEELLKA